MQRADGGVASGLLLFTATPQSIRLAAYCQLPGRGAFWVLPLTKSCPRLRGKCRGAAVTKGERLEAAKLFYCSPSDNPPKLSPGWNKVVLLTAVRNSPCSCPFFVSLTRPQDALNSEPRKRWRLIVRFTSSHIKPALKGEVAMSVSELTEGL